MKAVGLWLPGREGGHCQAVRVNLTRGMPKVLHRWKLPWEIGALKGLAREAGKVHWVVGLPGEDLAFRRLVLPFTGRRLSRALPYALEEHLPDDVERLCLAYLATPQGKGSEVRVWAVERDILEGQLERLWQAGIDPKQVVPQELAPWYAYGQALGDAWLFEPASPALLAFERGWPAARHVFSFREGARFTEECRFALEAFARRLGRREGLKSLSAKAGSPCPGDPLPVPFPYDPPAALACAARLPAFNLRTGALAYQGEARRLRRQAVAAAALASLGLAALALELDIRAQRLEARSAALRGELEGILGEFMPGARAVDVPHQLGRHLAQVEGQSPHPPLSLLAAALAVRPPGGVRLTALQIRGRDILWTGEGERWQAVNAWKMALERSGRFASVILSPRTSLTPAGGAGPKAAFTLRLRMKP